MANKQLNSLLEFAKAQLASEAFLLRQGEDSVRQLSARQLIARLVEGNTHASTFIPLQAEEFIAQYEVLAQYRNGDMGTEPYFLAPPAGK